MMSTSDEVNISSKVADETDDIEIIANLKKFYNSNTSSFFHLCIILSILILGITAFIPYEFPVAIWFKIVGLMLSVTFAVISLILHKEYLSSPVKSYSQNVEDLRNNNFAIVMEEEVFGDLIPLVEQLYTLTNSLSMKFSHRINLLNNMGIEIKTLNENTNSNRYTIEEISYMVDRLNNGLVSSQQSFETSSDSIGDLSNTLSELLNNIEDIKSNVSSLGKQTNMLALNAKIEAAKAGVYGKGFEVVATNIQKLSEQTNRVNQRIDNLKTSLENQVSKVLNDVSAGFDDFEAVLVQNRGVISQISSQIEKSLSNIQKISRAIIEIDEIQGSLLNLDNK
jgi:methyl-accepting chemotaxis protein